MRWGSKVTRRKFVRGEGEPGDQAKFGGERASRRCVEKLSS